MCFLYLLLLPPCEASAGTGKSFLLATVFLWCLVNGKRVRRLFFEIACWSVLLAQTFSVREYTLCLGAAEVKAVAPTGNAAANIEVARTDVSAATTHRLFELEGNGDSRMETGPACLLFCLYSCSSFFFYFFLRIAHCASKLFEGTYASLRQDDLEACGHGKDRPLSVRRGLHDG